MNRTRTQRRHPVAFTLIELLIVVAIIAILAAIAVPNFLEAQTRAKASRARSDLRTVATAIETYYIDNNAYPTMIEPGFTGGVIPWLQNSDLKWWYVPDSLSTPMAYLTSADLQCPFGGDKARSGDFPDNIWRRYSYEKIEDLEGKVDDFPVLNAKYGPEQRALERIGGWRLLCIGPDIAWNPMEQYDPTNGTTSLGNIMRTQNDTTGIGSEPLDPAPTPAPTS
jgi:prepilin-type N-terminal cleavage/methylation domain-containing protein